MNETLLHNKGVNSMKKMAKIFLTLLMMVTLMISSSLAFAEGENPEVTLNFLIQKTEDSAESKTYRKIAEMQF